MNASDSKPAVVRKPSMLSVPPALDDRERAALGQAARALENMITTVLEKKKPCSC